MRLVAAVILTIGWFFAYIGLSFGIEDQRYLDSSNAGQVFRAWGSAAIAITSYAFVMWQLLRRQTR